MGTYPYKNLIVILYKIKLLLHKLIHGTKEIKDNLSLFFIFMLIKNKYTKNQISG